VPPRGEQHSRRAKELSALGGLGLWAGPGLRADCVLSLQSRDELVGKPESGGVYVRKHLSLLGGGKTCEGYARVANRTRGIRPSGMTTGAAGNVAMVEL
jgi:hypothetical protein